MSRKDTRSDSFVRALLGGSVELSTITPYPTLSHGRVQQVEGLLERIRRDSDGRSGVDRLRSWDLLNRPIEWPTPLLARVIRQIGATDASAALSATAHLALGVRLVKKWGTESQNRRLKDASNALIAFALTEETPGSDVSRIQTYAKPTEDGFILSGTKHWVTNAVSATHFVVVARTAPPRAADQPKLTAFLVERQANISVMPVATDVLPGSDVGRVTFDQLRVAKTNVLGTVGKGFRVVVSGLAEARLFVASAVLGACIRAYNDTISRLTSRRAFGRTVARFPSVQGKVASMLSEIFAMESLVHAASGTSDIGRSVDPVERGVVRLGVSRSAARVLSSARDLHGAAAFTGNASASRHWADTQALTLLDGSDLALESYIFLEGTRELRRSFSSIASASDLLSRVDATAALLINKAKSRLGRTASVEIPDVRFQALEERTAQLGKAVEDAVRRHEVELVEKQHIHSRFASLTAELATWTAVCARVKTEVDKSGAVGAHRMTDVAQLWTRSAKTRVDQLLFEVSRNDDSKRDAVANLAYSDRAYPFDIF